MTDPKLQWVVIAPDLWGKLRNATDIREAHAPTLAQFVAERLSGWPGSDGSSNSPDTIWGLRVGRTTAEYSPHLATWCHDFDYRAIRRMLACGFITLAQAEELRRCADEALLVRMLRQIEAASWALRPLRRRRALLYYEGVLAGGSHSIEPRTDETYPRPQVTR